MIQDKPKFSESKSSENISPALHWRRYLKLICHAYNITILALVSITTSMCLISNSSFLIRFMSFIISTLASSTMSSSFSSSSAASGSCWTVICGTERRIFCLNNLALQKNNLAGWPTLLPAHSQQPQGKSEPQPQTETWHQELSHRVLLEQRRDQTSSASSLD